MTDDSQAIAATIVGAMIGGAAGYLFFSAHGRRMRRAIEPALDDLAREIASFRGTMRRALAVAHEGWLHDALDDGRGEARPFPNAHQTSPF